MTPSPVSPSSSSPQANSQDHPLTRLILHLLPDYAPSMTQGELMKCIQGVLPYTPDLHMLNVSQSALSAVLASLERKGCISSTSGSVERCYWRITPAPRSPDPATSAAESAGCTAATGKRETLR